MADEVIEIVNLCDSEPERGQPAEPIPFVRLGTITTRISISPLDLPHLSSSSLSIRRDLLATEFQLAVYVPGCELPISYLGGDFAQVFERVLADDYLRLNGEIGPNALKRQQSDNSVGVVVVVTVRPAFITAVFRLLQTSPLPFISEPTIFAMQQAQACRPPSPTTIVPETANPNILWNLFDSALRAIPTAAAPVEPAANLTTPMYDYQKAGLGWMIEREQDDANSELLQLFWTRFADAVGAAVFHNFFTGESMTSMPRGAFKGGILADDMGLGKTLQTIALITTNSSDGGGSGICALGATLIVSPVSVVGSWVAQFRLHVDAASCLRVLVYHGPDRFKQPIDDADVVITTYSTLAIDFKPIKDRPNVKRHGVFAKRWLRTVLDEAHIIRSQRSLQHAAVVAIDADRRWCLTGTPIQNHLDDFYALLKFLRAEPLNDYRIWSGVVVTPFKSGSAQGTERVQAIFRAVCLRRTKASEEASVSLPPKRVSLVKVVLSDVERRLYDILVGKGRSCVSKLVKSGNVMGGYAGVLEFLLRMRMCCDHPNLVPSHFFSESLSVDQPLRNPVEIFSEILQESQVEECCFCLQAVTDPCITTCAHLFCRQCIQQFVASHHVCPVCSSPLEENALLRPKTPDKKTNTTSVPYLEATFVPSKILVLLDQLNALRNKDRSIKSVLFSQWTGMLTIMQRILVKEGFRMRRLDGSMSRQQRESAIHSFQNDADVTIFIVSLQAGNVGLTLTAASCVFILDLWYNPGLEQQAIDRIHRIGQTRPVHVYRFVAVDTVEEKILQLQEKKKEIVKQTMSSTRKSVADKPKNVLEDIRYLFS